MLLIQAADVACAHGSRQVLAGASIAVKTDERSTLVEASAAGKSTQLILLTLVSDVLDGPPSAA